MRLGPLPAGHPPPLSPSGLGRQAQTIDVFITSPRIAKGEKQRLVPERDRALRAVAEIDAATPVPAGRS
ncbi:hypothetical protein [Streptomyces antnestii]|uniref:hypothetical protein n=1 Tax=Streptomyces antnestii TaxID=2494256 RepID=UPI0016743C8D|nr:hypothetical protein [Streptomyces sp. San01]